MADSGESRGRLFPMHFLLSPVSRPGAGVKARPRVEEVKAVIGTSRELKFLARMAHHLPAISEACRSKLGEFPQASARVMCTRQIPQARAERHRGELPALRSGPRQAAYAWKALHLSICQIRSGWGPIARFLCPLVPLKPG
jgi:hypothetical protein